MACSAASRSTIAPPFSPRERWWPMPMMRARCVRPAQQRRSRRARVQPGDEADDLAGADVEHRQDRRCWRGESGFSRGVKARPRWLTWRSPWLFWPCLDAFGARASAASSERRSTTRSGMAKVDGQHVAVERSSGRVPARQDGSPPAAAPSPAGCTSTPLSIFSVQRRCADQHRRREHGPRNSAARLQQLARRPRALVAAPSPTTSGSG